MVRLKAIWSRALSSLLLYFNSSMVRLKDSATDFDTPSTVRFQFQYGAIEGRHRNMNRYSHACCISIPVWCDWRLISNTGCPNSFNNFNSSMVRLKVRSNAGNVITFNDFNSSMVRLKDKNNFLYHAIKSSFQFQYGAIEGNSSIRWRFELKWFQFQYGAIEGMSPLMVSVPLNDFNSSMVRLKVSESKGGRGKVHHFNSSMVRLKEPPAPVLMIDTKFQFQYGAIEGGEPEADGQDDHRNFNSSMVRLKATRRSARMNLIEWISIPVWCDWRKEIKKRAAFIINFNSSMVRLKGTSLTRWQSTRLISIPVWCDWRHIQSSGSGTNAQISIPVWCDWR